MEWVQIREYYERAFRHTKLSQTTVAKAGGLKRPNVISKVLHNKKKTKGPAVETFLRMVLGLGLPPSEFFRTLEQYVQGEPEDAILVKAARARASRLVGPAMDRVAIQRATQVAVAAFLDALDPAPRPRRRALGKRR
jgi:transcriptional regulator with XRE-family HTH domain